MGIPDRKTTFGPNDCIAIDQLGYSPNPISPFDLWGSAIIFQFCDLPFALPRRLHPRLPQDAWLPLVVRRTLDLLVFYAPAPNSAEY